MPNGEGQTAAPTGCFKCGRPGHWSRDCPSSSATNSNPNPNPDPIPKLPTNSFKQPSEAAAGKKVRKSRPKLTPEILLSDEGLGYVLRHFPRAFKCHGRDHEVSDLGNLIGLYAEWHAHLIPYYSFDQFVRKVEQVGATRRVRRCMDELRQRVARGGDPTKLHETQAELDDQGKEPEQCGDEGHDAEETIFDMEDPPMEGHCRDQVQEDMINEIYEMAAEGSSPPQNKSSETSPAAASTLEPPAQTENVQEMVPKTKIQITEEQRARIEANRCKALERARARAAHSVTPCLSTESSHV